MWQSRLIRLLCLSGFVFLLGASPLDGQVQRTVGVHIGQVRSHQIWSGLISTDDATGLSIGVNVDVPAPLLSILFGAGYAGRGSVVWDEEVDPDRSLAANVRSHYMSFPLQAKLRFKLGPASVYLLAGPTVEYLMKTECTEDLCRVLHDERPAVFSGTVGGGGSMDFRDRFRADFEVRLTEGFSDAYVSNSSGIRYRSLEFLLRACFPF